MRINLCEDRYRFLVAFCAAAVRGQTTLLPPSRAPAVVDQVRAQYPDSYCLGDDALRVRRRRDCVRLPQRAAGTRRRAAADRRRSRGRDRLHLRQHRPAARLRQDLGQLPHQHRAEPRRAGRPAATRGRHATSSPRCRRSTCTAWRCRCCCRCSAPVAVHAARPFFPADVARALRDAPTPPLLVTTPVHLRALVESDAAIAAAGAASSRRPRRCRPELALAAEAALRLRSARGVRFHRNLRDRAPPHRARSGVDAAARRAPGAAARRHRGARAAPGRAGGAGRPGRSATPTAASSCAAATPTCSRSPASAPRSATSRASCSRCRASRTAWCSSSTSADAIGVRRIAALAVAPRLDEATILPALRQQLDPVFLPRPLRRVAALPRNETGKLPRGALAALLHG